MNRVLSVRDPEYPYSVRDHPRSAPEYPYSVRDHPRSAPEYPYSVRDHPRSVPEYPYSVRDHPRSVPEYPYSVRDHPRSAPEYPYSVRDHPRCAAEYPYLTPGHVVGPKDIAVMTLAVCGPLLACVGVVTALILRIRRRRRRRRRRQREAVSSASRREEVKRVESLSDSHNVYVSPPSRKGGLTVVRTGRGEAAEAGAPPAYHTIDATADANISYSVTV